MSTITNIDHQIVRKLDDYKSRGIKLALSRGRVRLFSPESEHILHSGPFEDISDIDAIVTEGFRRFVLIAMLSEAGVPPGGDYAGAIWAEEGLELYGHGEGSIPHCSFAYSISVRRSGLNWTEIWNWPTWPRSADIRLRYEQLKANYRSTKRLLALCEEQRMNPHFDSETNSVWIGDLRVTASSGTWQTGFEVQTSAQVTEILPALNAFSRFIDLDPKKALVQEAKPEAMISEVELV